MALHCALRNGASVEAVRRLVEQQPAAVSKASRFGKLPIHYAVRHAKLEVVEYMLSLNPHATKIPDEAGRLALHAALEYSASLGVVQAVLAANPAAVREADLDNGWLPLHYCMAEGASPAVVKLVCDANPEAAQVLDLDGLAPLHYGVAHEGPAEAIRVVVEAFPEAAPAVQKWHQNGGTSKSRSRRSRSRQARASQSVRVSQSRRTSASFVPVLVSSASPERPNSGSVGPNPALTPNRSESPAATRKRILAWAKTSLQAAKTNPSKSPGRKTPGRLSPGRKREEEDKTPTPSSIAKVQQLQRDLEALHAYRQTPTGPPRDASLRAPFRLWRQQSATFLPV